MALQNLTMIVATAKKNIHISFLLQQERDAEIFREAALEKHLDKRCGWLDMIKQTIRTLMIMVRKGRIIAAITGGNRDIE